jgi:TolA-binding protein
MAGETHFTCQECGAPCTVELTSGSHPRPTAVCTQCKSKFEIRLAPAEKKTGQWSVVNPHGEEVSFHSRDELRQAVMDDDIEPDAESISSMAMQAAQTAKTVELPAGKLVQDAPTVPYPLSEMDEDTVELQRPAPKSEREDAAPISISEAEVVTVRIPTKPPPIPVAATPEVKLPAAPKVPSTDPPLTFAKAAPKLEPLPSNLEPPPPPAPPKVGTRKSIPPPLPPRVSTRVAPPPPPAGKKPSIDRIISEKLVAAENAPGEPEKRLSSVRPPPPPIPTKASTPPERASLKMPPPPAPPKPKSEPPKARTSDAPRAASEPPKATSERPKATSERPKAAASQRPKAEEDSSKATARAAPRARAAVTLSEEGEKRPAWFVPAILMGVAVAAVIIARLMRPAPQPEAANPPAEPSTTAVVNAANPGTPTATASTEPSPDPAAAAASANAAADAAPAAEPTPTASAAASAEPSAVPVIAVSDLPTAKPTAEKPAGDAPSQPSAPREPSSPAGALRQAATAQRNGDYAQARKLYQSVIDKDSKNAEALSGLGDTSRALGDKGSAQAFYQRAVDASPSYIPALIGLADTQWDLGDKASAQKRYAQVVETFPKAPERVRQRAGLSGGAPSP